MVLLGSHKIWILGSFHGMLHRRSRHGRQHAARPARAVHYLGDAAVPAAALCGARTWLWHGAWQNICKGIDMHNTHHQHCSFHPPIYLFHSSMGDVTVYKTSPLVRSLDACMSGHYPFAHIGV